MEFEPTHVMSIETARLYGMRERRPVLLGVDFARDPDKVQAAVVAVTHDGVRIVRLVTS